MVGLVGSLIIFFIPRFSNIFNIGYHYLEFVKTLLDYPRHATRTVVVMDGATIHRNQEARKYLRDRGITVYILTPSSSELNPIEKCKCFYKIH